MKSLGSVALMIAGVVSLIFVAFYLTREEPPAAEQGGPPPFVLPVTLATVERGDLEPTIPVTGTVTSTSHARVGFLTAGRIRSLEVREGDVVAEDAVLGRLWDLDQQVELHRAEAERQLAQRELEKALAGERAEAVRRLEAELDVRRAEAALAQKEVERNRGLIGTEVISKSRFDELLAEADAAEARVQSAAEALAEARAGTREEDLAIRRAELELKEAEVGIAQREVDKTLLTAPFGCHVVRRLAALGDMVAAGAPVFELVDLDHREIEIEIPSFRVSQLGRRARVDVSVDDLPAFHLEAQLDSLVVLADEATRNFRGLVRIGPDQDREQVLKPGMFVRLDLHLEPLRSALLVPEDALRITPQGTVLVAARSEGPAAAASEGPPSLTAAWIPVRLLANSGGRIAVEVLPPADDAPAATLEAGDQVIVSGVDLAFPGAPLLPRPASGAAPAPAPIADADAGDAAAASEAPDSAKDSDS